MPRIGLGLDFFQHGIWDITAQEDLSQNHMTWFRWLVRARGTTLSSGGDRMTDGWLSKASCCWQGTHNATETRIWGRNEGCPRCPGNCLWLVLCVLIWNCHTVRLGRLCTTHMYIFPSLGLGAMTHSFAWSVIGPIYIPRFWHDANDGCDTHTYLLM